MREITSAEYTILKGEDWHFREFEIAHWHGHNFIDISIPLARTRSLHLGPFECRAMALRLLKFANTHQLTDPGRTADDFQI